MGSVHQLKVTLKGTKPPVWRRLQVPSAATLEDLHQVICAAFDWHGGHLHEFDAGGARFGEPHPDDYVAVEDERRVTLGRLAPAAGDTFDYLYDFGDSWEHRILVEKVMRPDAPQFHAVCLGGRRAAPPDDCGGVWGYEELLQILADPTHPEHHHYLEWAGGALDPESFSAGEVTRSLRYLAIGAPNATVTREAPQGCPGERPELVPMRSQPSQGMPPCSPPSLDRAVDRADLYLGAPRHRWAWAAVAAWAPSLHLGPAALGLPEMSDRSS